MRNWIITTISGAFLTVSGSTAFGLPETDENKINETPLGSCTVTTALFPFKGVPSAGVFVTTEPGVFRYAGATFWQENEIKTASKAPLSAQVIADCLGLPATAVSYFVADGADGLTYADDDLIGFGFVLSKDSGSFKTGEFYTFTIGSGTLPPPRTAKDGVQADAVRQLSSQISSNQRLVREGRERFITSRQQMAGGGSGLASRNVVGFDVDGTFNVDNGRVSTNGTFFEQNGNFEGTYRRLFFGDFDVQHDSDTDSTTAILSGKVAWEQMLDESNMLGYFLGANLAYSDIGGAFSGEQKSSGVSAGAYFVSALQENLFLDGFLSVGAGHNELELADGTVDLKGDYQSRTVSLGAALSGVIERDGYEIWPEIALSYGYTDLGTIGLTDRNAGSVDNRVSVDADNVSIANLTIRPEFRVPMDGRSNADSLSLFTFAPRLICERVEAVSTTEDCGGGAEIGLTKTSNDGASQFVARVKADRIASSTRTGLELRFEHQF